jgi:glycosyltransferase involved in cell wall biosynthesis
MEAQLISILMPAYNCEKFVKQAIDSILNQSYTHFELLIADDCSTDTTKKIMDSYDDERIKRFHNEKNLGYLKASNKLFKECQGEYITFQDADDYADKDRLKKLKQFLDENSEIACVGSNIVKVDPENKEFYKTKYPLNDDKIRAGFLEYRIVMTGSALMLRNKVIETCGVYNEYFDRIGSKDTYLYSYILEKFKVANLPEHLYYYRANPTSVGFTHKNPKAFVGHNLIVLMYERRLENKLDYISTNEWRNADKYTKFLLDINLISRSKRKAVFSFLKNFIASPLIGLRMFRMFIANLRA